MDTQQDHTNPTTPPSSGGFHVCHRCGWPFPNPHPSSKHRRAHNRICGTIEGYTNTNLVIHSSEPVSVSDDEHHSDEDEDKDKTPSPKIEKRIVKQSGGVGERSNKSEDDLFSDAVTEFSDSGFSPDITNLLDSPLDVRKVDGELKVFQTPDSHPKDADKFGENVVKVISNSADISDPKPSVSLVKDTDVSDEVKSTDIEETLNTVPTKLDSTKVMDDTSMNVDMLEVSDNNDQGEEAVYVLSVPSDIPLVDHAETLIEDFKDHKTKYSNVPFILDPVGNDDVENRSLLDAFEIKKAEVKIEESKPSENAESSMESAVSEHTNAESSAFVPTVIIKEAKVSETQSLELSKTVPESTDNLSEADVSTHKRSVVTPSESTEKAAASEEINQGKLESDHEHVSEVVEKAEVDQSVPVLAEDFGSEKLSEAFTQETVKEPESGIEVDQKIVASVSDDLKDSGNSRISQRSLEKDEELVDKASRVSETLVNEADDKLIPNQDCGVDASVGSSSRNSLEGNWGSVSVLSTASIDAENAHSVGKSEAAAEKSRLGKLESFGGSSFVEIKEEASEINSVAVEASQSSKSEASRAGWLSSEASETEVRKRNEEAIAKVTNWSTSQPTTTPIKNLISEAKISNPKPVSNTIQKDEASENISEPGKSKPALETPLVNQESSSPTEDNGEGKKGRKKGKGRALWLPFVCCSSINDS